jgi:HEAT repeat protein
MSIRIHVSLRPAIALLLVGSCLAQSAQPGPAGAAPGVLTPADNPYRLQPFHADFPLALEYPPRIGAEYVRTRRQILERLAANLQGNVRREAWQAATEFFWRAPEDAAEPLIEAMDRAFGKAGYDDVVKNCVEAMGRMGLEVFDAPLRRALHHANPVVQQAAFAALGTAGKVETLRELAGAFPQMDGRARGAWLRSVRVRLGVDGTPLLQAVMNGPFAGHVRDQVLKEALQLPPASAAAILRGRWDEAVAEFKAIIAGVLHAAGDPAGTAWLRESLAGEDLQRLQWAVRHCAFGEVGDLREPLLRASTHLRPDVRLEVAKVLTRVPGDDVADVFEALVAPDEPWDVRAIALRELTRRNRGKAVDVLLDEVATASGTRLHELLAQLSASGDPRAVPVLLDRFRKAPEAESRPFAQALAQNHSAAAAAALFELYRGPDKVVGRGSVGELTTRNYLPTLFLNLRGSERVILDGYLQLPKEEWRLRAPLLATLSGYAADRTDPELQAACVAPLRAILFDRTELPQLRVLALNQLTLRWLTIDDVLKLKNTHRDEATGLRLLFADFLSDFF